jgi:hypothetical protein
VLKRSRSGFGFARFWLERNLRALERSQVQLAHDPTAQSGCYSGPFAGWRLWQAVNAALQGAHASSGEGGKETEDDGGDDQKHVGQGGIDSVPDLGEVKEAVGSDAEDQQQPGAGTDFGVAAGRLIR